jgi:hypothetical protein
VSLTGPWHVARLCIILAGGPLVGRPATSRGTVVSSLGRIWLFEADSFAAGESGAKETS